MGPEVWHSENGLHTKVDFPINQAAVKWSSKEEVTVKKIYNIFQSKQCLRWHKLCPTELTDVHEKVQRKYRAPLKCALQSRNLNVAYSLWKEAIASRKDPRVKGYAEVVACPDSPFYVSLNTKTIGSQGKLCGNVHIFMGIEFGKINTHFSDFTLLFILNTASCNPHTPTFFFPIWTVGGWSLPHIIASQTRLLSSPTLLIASRNDSPSNHQSSLLGLIFLPSVLNTTLEHFPMYFNDGKLSNRASRVSKTPFICLIAAHCTEPTTIVVKKHAYSLN